MEVHEYAPGSFCWFELGTSDGTAAKQFYTELFGWTTLDHDMGEDGVYTMLQKNGKAVGALYEDKRSGTPPHWNSYVSVTDVDASAAKADSLGAKVVVAPFDVMDIGRMAVIQDPTGAFLSLWQPRAHQGAEVVDEVGAFGWNELVTKDVPGAAAFYTALFGWQTKGEPGVAAYVEWINNGRSVGGLLKMPEMAESAGVPPNWLPYVEVADCDATAEAAKRMGASLWVPPTDIPDVGRFSVFGDPQGAGIAVVQLKS